MAATMSDYMEVCEVAVRAGATAVQQWIDRFKVREKGPADLVTEADFASQETIRKTIHDHFPDHYLLGEEDPQDAQLGAQAEFRWIADPLDGTTNYVHRVPHYSVSLALEHRGELLVGAVYDPTHDECFTAAAGQSAFLNGQRIRTSAVSDLSSALAVVGFPPKAKRSSPDVAVFLEALERCQAIRRTGSAALNLCYLAAGRFDVYWSYSTKIWDVAAGALIVREAGGEITAPSGGEFVLQEARFLAAANPRLHAELRAMAARVTSQLPG